MSPPTSTDVSGKVTTAWRRAKLELTPAQNETLRSAAATAYGRMISGSVLGAGVGAALAWRINNKRRRVFKSLIPGARPTLVQFADGRMVPVEQLLKTSRLRTVPVYLILGVGGLGLGTLLGSLSGVVAALRVIGRDDDLTRWLNDTIQRARADSVERNKDMVDQPPSEL